jgi:peroxiredoxin Q/BCP
MLFSKPLPVGAAAPSFLCPDEEGNLVSLERHRGSYVLLVFYPGDRTPVCTRQLCAMRDNWKLLQERGVKVFGVNPRSARSHQRFRRKHGFPFPLLVDAGQKVAAIYGAKSIWTQRTVYLIDGAGIIRFSERGNPTVGKVLAALG